MPQAPPLAFVHECYYVCLKGGGAELAVWHSVYHLFPFTPFYLPFGKIRRIVRNQAKGLSSLGLSDVLEVFISRKWLRLGLDKDIVKKGKISTKVLWLKLYLKFTHVWHPFKMWILNPHWGVCIFIGLLSLHILTIPASERNGLKITAWKLRKKCKVLHLGTSNQIHRSDT